MSSRPPVVLWLFALLLSASSIRGQDFFANTSGACSTALGGQGGDDLHLE